MSKGLTVFSLCSLLWYVVRQAEARTLAEMYGGKLASEFNSKTSHVIMTTGMSVHADKIC